MNIKRIKNMDIRRCVADYWQFENIHKLDWVVASVVIAIVALTALYRSDVVATFRLGIIFDEALFSGQLMNINEILMENVISGYIWGGNAFGLVLLFIIGILSLPMYLIRLISGYDLTETLVGLIYIKIVLISLSAFCGFIVYKIQKLLTSTTQNACLSAFLFVTSPLVICSTFVSADLIPLSAMLLMMYMHLRGDSKLFLLASFAGILLKDYAIFLFIPLLLLQEKKLIKIIYKSIIGVSGYIVVNHLLFAGNAAKQAFSGPWRSSHIGVVVGSTFSAVKGNVSIFICLFVIICIFAYMRDAKNDSYVKDSLFVALGVIASFAIGTGIYFNWLVIIVPFILIPMLFSDQDPIRFKVNLILETTTCTCFVVYWMFVDQGFLSNHIFDNMLLSRILSRQPFRFSSLSEFLGVSTEHINLLHIVIRSLILACFIGLVVNHYPKKGGPKLTYSAINVSSNRAILLLRTIILLPLLAIILVSAVATKPIEKTVWGYPAPATHTYQIPPFDENLVIEQKAVFKENVSASALMTWFVTEPDNLFFGKTSVQLTIKEAKSERVLFSETFPLVSTVRGDWTVEKAWDIEGVEFYANTEYLITIKGRWVTERWYSVLADALPETELRVNGEVIDGLMVAMRLVASEKNGG